MPRARRGGKRPTKRPIKLIRAKRMYNKCPNCGFKLKEETDDG